MKLVDVFEIDLLEKECDNAASIVDSDNEASDRYKEGFLDGLIFCKRIMRDKHGVLTIVSLRDIKAENILDI